jgi:hypothetical protein
MSLEEMKWLVRVKNGRDTLNQLAEERRSRLSRRDDHDPFHSGIHQRIQKWRDFAFRYGLLDSNGSNTLEYPENERFFIRLMCCFIFFEKVYLRKKISHIAIKKQS